MLTRSDKNVFENMYLYFICSGYYCVIKWKTQVFLQSATLMQFRIMLCSNGSNTVLLWKNKVRQSIESKNLMVHGMQYIDLLSRKIPT